MFNWIRARVRDAFLAGCQDAVDVLTAPPQPAKLDPPEPRLLRLPGPEADDGDEVAAPRKKKTS